MVDVIVQVERFFCEILVCVVQLYSETERTVLLDRVSHEKSSCKGEETVGKRIVLLTLF